MMLRTELLTHDITGDIMLVVLSYVLDTNILVAAFRSKRGASRQMLQAALDRRFRLLLSVSLLFEYEAVLKRPAHLAASGLNSVEVERVLDDLVDVAIPVGAASGRRLELVDPNDVMVFETAVTGGADAIVTFNVRHFVREGVRSRIRIILPGQALGEIGGSKRL